MSIYDDVSPYVASRVHLTTGTLGAIFYFLYGLGLYSPFLLPLVATLDLSTAYFVIGGCLAERYKSIENAKTFFLIHVVPGVLAYATLPVYVLSFLIYPLPFLFWVFAALWTQAYVTGVWAFFKLKK